MCMCKTPTINGEPGYSWDGKSESVRQPHYAELEADDQLLYDLPGRCGGLDSHCHDFRIVKQRGEGYLLVHHGGGSERLRLGARPLLGTLPLLSDHARYWMMQALYHVQQAAAAKARADEMWKWRAAAAEKRIKTRKYRGQDGSKVWIVPRANGTE